MTFTTQSDEKAREIISAMQKISDTEELRAEAATNPESVMNRLGLSGVARHAVAFGIAALLVAPTAPVSTDGYWV